MRGVVSGLSAVQAMKDVKSICGEGWWAVGDGRAHGEGLSRSTESAVAPRFFLRRRPGAVRPHARCGGVPAFGEYRATHARCMLATFQVEGSAPLRGADLSSCK